MRRPVESVLRPAFAVVDQPVEVAAGAAAAVNPDLEGVDGQVGAATTTLAARPNHAGERVDDERDVHTSGVGCRWSGQPLRFSRLTRMAAAHTSSW